MEPGVILGKGNKGGKIQGMPRREGGIRSAQLWSRGRTDSKVGQDQEGLRCFS